MLATSPDPWMWLEYRVPSLEQSLEKSEGQRDHGRHARHRRSGTRDRSSSGRAIRWRSSSQLLTAPRTSTLHAPLHRLTGPHRAHHGVAKGILARDGPRRTAQRDGAAVPRQPVEVGAVEGRKALQLVQRPRLLKGVRVQRQRHGRAVDSGAAARRLLCAHGVRCAVRAQEEAGVAAGGCLQHCLAMLLPLQHGQTVVVRPQATHK
mmetsp:Transcript_42298/g.109705  ORF Transcript_42298/g.109705 Transcript_42298/m.109705 type:complete len:206 (+) Transcript_42298:121-738(+)